MYKFDFCSPFVEVQILMYDTVTIYVLENPENLLLPREFPNFLQAWLDINRCKASLARNEISFLVIDDSTATGFPM